ncbi:MAG TPA: helix-turn-helix domain-containing protein [Ktedonobacterales bacterium]
MASNKRGEQAERRRAQLIDAALDVFSERGVEATRISDIAERAGVAQGLLYHYFPGKEALLRAIAERHSPLPIISSILMMPPERPARETLLDVASRVYALMQQERQAVRLALRDILWWPTSREVVMGVREMALGFLTRYLQSRIDVGELRPHDTMVVGQTYISVIFMPAVVGLPFDPYIPGAIEVILDGIAARSPTT